MIEVLYTLTHKEAIPPTRAYDGDAGWDLHAVDAVQVPGRSWVDVPAGVAIAVPDGYFARIVGRSSTWRRHGLLVIEGIIDAGFRGELFACVFNPGTESVRVGRGQRLAQVIVQEVRDSVWNERPSLPESHRGTAGFGSSGS